MRGAFRSSQQAKIFIWAIYPRKKKSHHKKMEQYLAEMKRYLMRYKKNMYNVFIVS